MHACYCFNKVFALLQIEYYIEKQGHKPEVSPTPWNVVEALSEIWNMKYNLNFKFY